ncbi:hypothetical protein TNCV_3775431 [Trichonephila clavipes]|nr:hypothetical protein TNCV_3775431 [Trichonephila clavipes]
MFGQKYRLPPHSERMVVARDWQQWITEEIFYHSGLSELSRNTNVWDDFPFLRALRLSPTKALELVRCHLPAFKHPIVSRETI